MKITFLINSESVNLDKYTIKDIPGSSGRLDVIARCILSSILQDDGFDENYKIHIFFKNYGAIKFDPKLLDFSTFPKNELKLSEYIVQLILNKDNKEKLLNNPLKNLKIKNKSMMEFLKKKEEKDFQIFVLKEDGEDFCSSIKNSIISKEFFFVIGNQSEDLINSEAFLKLNLPCVNIGENSYLASSVIRIIKFNLKHLFY